MTSFNVSPKTCLACKEGCKSDDDVAVAIIKTPGASVAASRTKWFARMDGFVDEDSCQLVSVRLYGLIGLSAHLVVRSEQGMQIVEDQ